MSNYLPTKELELQAWTGNFLNVAAGNLPALGLTTTDVQPANIAFAGFSDALAAVTAARAACDSAVQTKTGAAGTLDHDVRALVKRIQSHPGVPDSLKAQLGINVPNPVKNRTAPIMPADVQAKPLAVGVNTLKWQRAGNKSTTQYVILAKTLTNGARAADESGWSMVGQTTRLRFAHTGVTPGVPMAYKVMAARADQSSLPSLPATVYGW